MRLHEKEGKTTERDSEKRTRRDKQELTTVKTTLHGLDRRKRTSLSEDQVTPGPPCGDHWPGYEVDIGQT
ncbi:hypothetical protein ElyMa_006777400 [Elysia marginata]|uniref:Uncharacterized protein n=1 Tax=Elysia marginata TaxID=1093978 RepID=A0AAV4J244_9GAST|nr:hypothetical protein ElyMa_006777400 [Elysia marginata]